jgi:hypothetical protein
MLGVASLSAGLATFVLVAYFWSVAAANRWNTARFVLTAITIGFGLIMWAVAAASTNGTSDFEGIGTQSLWSAACDATAQQLQYFDKDINFKRFCMEQVLSLLSPLPLSLGGSLGDIVDDSNGE